MKALRYVENRLQLAEIVAPAAAGEALIRVIKSGICNTDLEIVRGYAGFSGTLGHEFVGVVEACGDENLVGKRVVGEINAGCGNCEKCAAGDARHCFGRTVLGIHGRDGAHAEYATLPAENLLEVPFGVSDDEAVFVEPLAAAWGILEQTRIEKDTRVAVIGDGKLGLLCAMCLAIVSEAVVLIGKHDEKLQIARARGIETLKLEHVRPAMRRAFDVVVEASGSASGLATALDLLKPRGKLILKSTFQGETKLEMWRIVVEEISVIGSRCGRFAPALKLLEDKIISVADLISDEFALGDGIKAMHRAGEKGALKIILTMAN